MLTQFFYTFLEGSHLLFVAQHAQNVVSGYYAQLRIERLKHLQMHVVGAVEYHAVNVF